MHSWDIKKENGRFRWTVYRHGEKVMTGTRKHQNEAEREAKGSIKHTEKIMIRDKADAAQEVRDAVRSGDNVRLQKANAQYDALESPPKKKPRTASLKREAAANISQIEKRIEMAKASMSIGRPSAEDIARTDALVKRLEGELAALSPPKKPRTASLKTDPGPVKVQDAVKGKGTPIPKPPKGKAKSGSTPKIGDKTLATASGMDAGNRSMKAGGRTAWNADDFNAASRAHAKVSGNPAVAAPTKPSLAPDSTATHTAIKNTLATERSKGAKVMEKLSVPMKPATPSDLASRGTDPGDALAKSGSGKKSSFWELHERTMQEKASRLAAGGQEGTGARSKAPLKGGTSLEAAPPRTTSFARDGSGRLAEGWTSKSKGQLIEDAVKKGMGTRKELRELPIQIIARKLGHKGMAGLAIAAGTAAAMGMMGRSGTAQAAQPKGSGKTRTDPYTDKLGRNFKNGRLIVRQP